MIIEPWGDMTRIPDKLLRIKKPNATTIGSQQPRARANLIRSKEELRDQLPLAKL